MKKTLSVFLIFMLVLSFAACAKAETVQQKEFVIILENTTEDLLRGASVTLRFGDEVFGSMGMEHADGSLLGEDMQSYLSSMKGE